MSLILTDIAVQRQVLLERFKAAQVRKFTAVLQRVDADIRRQLSGGKLTDFRRSRLEAQLAGIKQLLNGHYREYVEALNGDLQQLATDSAVFESNTLKAYAPSKVSIATPAPNQVWSAVNTNPLTMPGANGGSLLQPFMESWADGDAEMVTNVIRTGYALGETNEQIISRIRGNAATNFADGALAQNRAHAATVTRTAIQHVANQARAESWKANEDIIDEYQWVSTLDSRTTPLCRDRDLKKFPVGKGPLPPAHPNCRSTTVAVIKGEFGRLLDEEAERASVNGPVPAGESYYDWLKRQDAGFQDLALGPTRGKLFRDGGLSVEEFSTLQLGRNFEPMSLLDMRKIEPEAFKRAGLDTTALAIDYNSPTALADFGRAAKLPMTAQGQEILSRLGKTVKEIDYTGQWTSIPVPTTAAEHANMASMVDGLNLMEKRFGKGGVRLVGHTNAKARANYDFADKSIGISQNFFTEDMWARAGRVAPVDNAILAKFKDKALADRVRSSLANRPFSLSRAPADTMIHEYGHHLERPLKLGKMAKEAFKSDYRHTVSAYGSSNYEELLAESMLLYVRGPVSEYWRIYPGLLDLFKAADKAPL